MSKLIGNISRFTILFLGVISVVLVALIYFGGNAESLSVGEDSLTVPKFTDALLYWCYFLFVLAVGITLLLTLIGFVKNLIVSPKDGLKSVIVLVVFVVLFLIAWFLGSPEKVSIIGYEGTDNEGFWAQFTDMIIYVSYVLFIAIAVTIAGSAIYSKLK